MEVEGTILLTADDLEFIAWVCREMSGGLNQEDGDRAVELALKLDLIASWLPKSADS